MQQLFVYIIYSQSHNFFYKGYSLNPEDRLVYHNNNESRYTANKGPWELVYFAAFENKKDALIEERRLKKLNRKSIEAIIKNVG